MCASLLITKSSTGSNNYNNFKVVMSIKDIFINKMYMKIPLISIGGKVIGTVNNYICDLRKCQISIRNGYK